MTVGLSELLILGLACVVLVGLPIAVVLVLLLNRRDKKPPAA